MRLHDLIVRWSAAVPDRAVPDAPPVDPPLRVAFDARCWEMTGLGTYTRELLAAFARLGAPVAWTILGPPALRDRLPAGLAVERFVAFEAPIYGPRALLRYPPLPGVEALHYPHYNLPLARVPARVVNVFDLFHLQFGDRLRRLHQGWYLRRLRRSRAHVVTASSHVARELLARGWDAARVHTIAPGPGRRPPPAAPSPPDDVVAATGTPLAPPWFLCLGTDQPHKNMEFLIAAMGLYYLRRPQAPPLVWMGAAPEAIVRWSRRLPAQLRARLALEPRGPAERAEALWSGALALLFPSLAEGFGFPPLEAMARGVPVVCARREPMTTLLGRAALYFEPTESASLWRALDWLLDRPEVRRDLQTLGRERAAAFDWDQTARHTLALYRRLTRGEGSESVFASAAARR